MEQKVRIKCYQIPAFSHFSRGWVSLTPEALTLIDGKRNLLLSRLSPSSVSILPDDPKSHVMSFQSPGFIFHLKFPSKADKSQFHSRLAEAAAMGIRPVTSTFTLVQGAPGQGKDLRHHLAALVTQKHSLATQKSLSDLSRIVEKLKQTFGPHELLGAAESAVASANEHTFREIRMVREICGLLHERSGSTSSLNSSFQNIAEPRSPSPDGGSQISDKSAMVEATRLVPIMPRPQSLAQLLTGVTDSRIRQLLTSNASFARFPVRLDQIGPRLSLPFQYLEEPKFNVMRLIKDSVGKDMSKITTPAIMNEPLSGTQKGAEQLEFAHILTAGAANSDRFLRLAHVAAFVVMNCSRVINRTRKPFNPLLGETYEFVSPDFRCVSEQVSHHPPVCAFFAEAAGWELESTTHYKFEIGLSSAKISNVGPYRVTFKQSREEFSIFRPRVVANNFLMGQVYMWVDGKFEVINESTGDRAYLTFAPKSNRSDKEYLVSGEVLDPSGAVRLQLRGRWDQALYAILPGTGDSILIGSTTRIPPEARSEFFLSDYAKRLNDLPPQFCLELPRTDTRFRPDIRAYEHGDIELAEREKIRLEESQRARARERTEPFRPLWFECKENNQVLVARFNRRYWDAKATHEWPPTLLDLYN